MPAVPWCILVVNCTCANNAFLYSFEYQNGWLWRWHAWAHAFRAREQNELEFIGLALNITQSKRPGVWKDPASVNSAIKMVTIFSSAVIFQVRGKSGNNWPLGHNRCFLFFFQVWVLDFSVVWNYQGQCFLKTLALLTSFHVRQCGVKTRFN